MLSDGQITILKPEQVIFSDTTDCLEEIDVHWTVITDEDGHRIEIYPIGGIMVENTEYKRDTFDSSGYSIVVEDCEIDYKESFEITKLYVNVGSRELIFEMGNV